jgi:hypothetical protein
MVEIENSKENQEPHHAALHLNEASYQAFICIRDFRRAFAFLVTFITFELGQMHPVIIKGGIIVCKCILGRYFEISSDDMGWIIVKG